VVGLDLTAVAAEGCSADIYRTFLTRQQDLQALLQAFADTEAAPEVTAGSQVDDARGRASSVAVRKDPVCHLTKSAIASHRHYQGVPFAGSLQGKVACVTSFRGIADHDVAKNLSCAFQDVREIAGGTASAAPRIDDEKGRRHSPADCALP
jgi:hypothetical protein